MAVTNKWKITIDKTYIGYSLAPLINKAIRAGDSLSAMKYVIFEPEKVIELDKYKKLQSDSVCKVMYSNYESLNNLITQYINMGMTRDEALTSISMKGYVTELIPRKYEDDYIIVDISAYGVHPNYAGVIAGKISGDNNKNTACYTLTESGKVKGSFRGRNNDTDYRSFFEQYSDDIYAQGHPPAFGFECTLEQLKDIMSKLNTIETVFDTKEFFSVGNIPVEDRGIYHITSFDEFKKNGYLLRIGIGNSKVSGKDEVYIKVPANEVVLKEIKGKLYTYDVLGLECKAFEQLSGKYFRLYIEFTNELNSYIKKY